MLGVVQTVAYMNEETVGNEKFIKCAEETFKTLKNLFMDRKLHIAEMREFQNKFGQA